MAEPYKNPPLIEVVCEFRFQESRPWDLVFSGLIFDKVRSKFPISSQRNDFEFLLNNQESQQTVVQRAISIFSREDERALIQISPNLLSVNHLKPYPTWPIFKEMIKEVFHTYVNIVNPMGITRIGLRYINRIEIPYGEDQSLKIEDYLTVYPKTPIEIPDTFTSWGQRVEVPFKSPEGLLILQTANVRENNVPNSAVFLVDLDFVTFPDSNISLKNALDWIQKAHDEVIEKTFENCITEKTRLYFR
jgi:uncharacterized protein (TIGR04255 family)